MKKVSESENLLPCLRTYFVLQGSKENRETTKEEEPSKSSSDSTVTKTEEEKIKAPKKQKLVHEITMELDVNDVPDLGEDELKRSMKRWVRNGSAKLEL